MKLIYGVLCHKNSKVLKKMIDILSVNNKIYLHIDLKSNINDFNEYINNHNVFFIKNRIDVNWGEFSLVEATLSILNETKTDKFDYINIISGDCLPLKSNKAISEFFLKNNGFEFIGIENDFNNKDLINRVKYIYPKWIFSKENKYKSNKFIRKIRVKFNIFKKNKYMKYIPKLYKGCNWFSITKNLSDYILDYIDNNKEYYNAFKNSFCSDEIFFHTIVMNSKYKCRVYKSSSRIDDNFKALRYIDWKSGPDYPKILTESDFKNISKTECLIGRKFNEKLDLNKYDEFFMNNN